MQLDNFVEMDQQGKGTFDTRKFHKNSPRLGKFLKTHISYNQGVSNYFPSPCSLSVFPPGRVRAAGFRPEGGGRAARFSGAKCPKTAPKAPF